MPINRLLYAEDWSEIARAVKEAAAWRCAACGRQCHRPGERVRDWQRVLTVAHLDQDPANNAPENLKALCVVCHLNHDRADNLRKVRRTWALKRAGPTLKIWP